MQGIDLSAVSERFSFLEQLREKISRSRKLIAWLAAHLSWASLRNAKVPQTAVILFTSGSETLPKAVPLSHSNLIANIRDVLSAVKIYETDRLIGFLPPFHSFGLTVTMLLPLLAGAQAVYSPNPTEADTLAKIIDAYRVTVLAGTPTFVDGIVRVATVEQLDTLRFAVTGAEKCPKALYDALAAKCPKAVILEGYGVTECSPIISLNDENDPKPFSIGKLIPSLECILLHPETLKPLSPPATGVLLVRGPKCLLRLSQLYRQLAFRRNRRQTILQHRRYRLHRPGWPDDLPGPIEKIRQTRRRNDFPARYRIHPRGRLSLGRG